MAKAPVGSPTAMGNHPRVRVPSLSANFYKQVAGEIDW